MNDSFLYFHQNLNRHLPDDWLLNNDFNWNFLYNNFLHNYLNRHLFDNYFFNLNLNRNLFNNKFLDFHLYRYLFDLYLFHNLLNFNFDWNLYKNHLFVKLHYLFQDFHISNHLFFLQYFYFFYYFLYHLLYHINLLNHINIFDDLSFNFHLDFLLDFLDHLDLFQDLFFLDNFYLSYHFLLHFNFNGNFDQLYLLDDSWNLYYLLYFDFNWNFPYFYLLLSLFLNHYLNWHFLYHCLLDLHGHFINFNLLNYFLNFDLHWLKYRHFNYLLYYFFNFDWDMHYLYFRNLYNFLSLLLALRKLSWKKFKVFLIHICLSLLFQSFRFELVYNLNRLLIVSLDNILCLVCFDNID